MTTILYRSGTSLYLVRRGDGARLVDVDASRVLPEGDFQAIVAHSNVAEPWMVVEPGEGVPAIVATVARTMEGRRSRRLTNH